VHILQLTNRYRSLVNGTEAAVAAMMKVSMKASHK